jgi:para-aminobenzoate synthetase component 1
VNKTQSFFYLDHVDKFLHLTEPLYAYIYYKNFKIDLLSGQRTDFDIGELKVDFEQKKFSKNYPEPIIYHCFFELGYIFEDLANLVKETTPLYIKIKYSKSSEIAFDESKPFDDNSLSPKEYPRYKQYKKQFKRVMNHLLRGDCYQINLTSPFYLNFESWSPEDFLQKLWSEKKARALFAHATYIHGLDKLYISNSPECLFKYYQGELFSLPIKGTKKVLGDSQRTSAFSELVDCKKEQAELYMISDLIRNDLTRIELTPAKVVAKKVRLDVPNIVHQFSILKVKLSPKANLWQAMCGLFPGGSVTGAPKNNVMQFINEIEHYDRGFYCGSTVMLYKKTKSASINIRSSEIDFNLKELKYGSGGGVTLLSESRAEFDEIFTKMDSFLQLIKFKS